MWSGIIATYIYTYLNVCFTIRIQGNVHIIDLIDAAVFVYICKCHFSTLAPR
jgi:hypothetical protein